MATFTLTVAFLGAITGISGVLIAYFAHRREANRDNVRVRVTAMNAIGSLPSGGHERFLAVTVLNLSTFPVTISEIGLEAELTKFLPSVDELHRLPLRLESRTSETVYYRISKFADKKGFAEVKKACAKTQCGHVFDSEPILAEIAEFLKEDS